MTKYKFSRFLVRWLFLVTVSICAGKVEVAFSLKHRSGNGCSPGRSSVFSRGDCNHIYAKCNANGSLTTRGFVRKGEDNNSPSTFFAWVNVEVDSSNHRHTEF